MQYECQIVRREDHPSAVEHENFQTVLPLRAEYKNIAAIRIALHAFRNQRDEAMDAFSKINRLRRNEHAEVRAKQNHRVPRSAKITASSVARSTPAGTRIVAPPILTSITARKTARARCDRLRRDGAGPRRARLAGDLHRREDRKMLPRLRQFARLSPPDGQNPAAHAIAARDFRDVRSRFQALRDDPRLLGGRPILSPRAAGDHLDPPISAGFMPGFEHGIFHRATLPANQMQRECRSSEKNLRGGTAVPLTKHFAVTARGSILRRASTFATAPSMPSPRRCKRPYFSRATILRRPTCRRVSELRPCREVHCGFRRSRPSITG